MARKRYTAEQIIGKLLVIEVHINSGMTAKYRPPAPEAWLVVEPDSTSLRPAQQPLETTVRPK